jgi:hypothetical protein
VKADKRALETDTGFDPEPTLNSEDFAQRTMAAAVAAKE